MIIYIYNVWCAWTHEIYITNESLSNIYFKNWADYNARNFAGFFSQLCRSFCCLPSNLPAPICSPLLSRQDPPRFTYLSSCTSRIFISPKSRSCLHLQSIGLVGILNPGGFAKVEGAHMYLPITLAGRLLATKNSFWGLSIDLPLSFPPHSHFCPSGHSSYAWPLPSRSSSNS